MSVLERLGLGTQSYRVHHAPDFASALHMARELAT